MKVTTGYAEVNNARLYYEMAGEGHPLVFIHGNTLDTRMWDDQFDLFASDHTVIRYDLRGYGRSSLPTPEESYAHHDDLKALLDNIGISKAHVTGLSMGGRVATDFTIVYPQIVSSLTLVDSVVHGYVNQFFLLNDLVAKAAEEVPSAANRMWFEHELFAPARQHPQVAKKLAEIIADYSGWHWLNKNPWTPLDPKSMEQLNKINVKTLVVLGDQDLPDFHNVADILHRNIAGATKKIIKGAGHMSNMEAPKEFNEILKEFLQGV